MHSVVVTGFNGFIGTQLCKQLQQQGYYVRCLNRSSAKIHRQLELVPQHSLQNSIPDMIRYLNLLI